MVDIKSAVIIKPTLFTFTAEAFNYFKLLFPVIVLLSLDGVTIFIPEAFLTFRCAKSSGTWLATFLAFSVLLPPRFEITLLVAIFTVTIFNPVTMHHDFFTAVLTYDFNL